LAAKTGGIFGGGATIYKLFFLNEALFILGVFWVQYQQDRRFKGK